MFDVTTLEEVEHNQEVWPGIDKPGLYSLNCDTGSVAKIVTLDAINAFLRSQGYTPDQNDKFCHVMPNFDMTRVMTRWELKEEGVLFSCNMQGGDKVIFPSRPLHQLWFDNETYFAVNREAQSICRFKQDGTEVETLAGPGNHIDASPNRQWFVTDSIYHQTPITIRLYPRGDTEPAAELDRHNFYSAAWGPFGGHANPVFSRDGKYVYFNRASQETQVNVVRVNIEPIMSDKK